MKAFFTLLFASLLCSANAQNLIDNGGFETYSALPNSVAQYYYAIGWTNCNGGGSPDYCHVNGSGMVKLPNCVFATLNPYEGNGIMGFALWHEGFLFREYVAHQLTNPLTAGVTYKVSFYLTTGYFNGGYGGSGSDQMSVAFSKNPLVQSGWNQISVTPQYVMGSVFYDSTWQQFSFQFTADSAYDYVTFGNFTDDNNSTIQFFQDAGIQTVYYFLDGIEIIPDSSSSSPDAFFISNDSLTCENSCLNFSDQSTNNPTSWQWSFPGGNPSSSALQNPTNICYYVAGTYDVTLIATNSAGSDTITLSSFITVNAAPTVTIVQSNDTLYSSAGNSYQWYTGGNPINGATDDFYVPSTEDFYSVVITDANGCTAADTIFFSLSPQTNFAASDTTICQKFCMDFFDQSGNNPTTWKWSFPGGVPSSSNQQNPTQICYNNPGVYDVTLITTNSFGSDTLVLTGYITVYSTPAFPTITVTGDILTSSYASSYQWQFNSADIPGATNQSYTATQTGYYTVIITDENGCVSSTTVYIEVTGVESVDGDFGFSVYPNPSNGDFIIQFSTELSGIEISIVMMNSLGQEVYSSVQKFSPGSTSPEIHLAGIAAGIYFIGLETKAEMGAKKILIIK